MKQGNFWNMAFVHWNIYTHHTCHKEVLWTWEEVLYSYLVQISCKPFCPSSLLSTPGFVASTFITARIIFILKKTTQTLIDRYFIDPIIIIPVGNDIWLPTVIVIPLLSLKKKKKFEHALYNRLCLFHTQILSLASMWDISKKFAVENFHVARLTKLNSILVFPWCLNSLCFLPEG